jgi:hypothetical protein
MTTIVSDYPSTILFDKFFHLFFDHLFQLAISPIIISYRDYTSIFCDERTSVRNAGLNAGDDYVESF